MDSKSNCFICEIAIPLSKSNCVICEIAKIANSQIAKVAKIANRNLCFLRKLRIFILRFFLSMNQLEFGQNEHRKDAPHFSFGSRRIFLVHFYPNIKFKFEKFWKFRIQFRLINFSKKKSSI